MGMALPFPGKDKAFAMWVERQQRNLIEAPIAVRCDGCGAYHNEDEWCSYCGNGKPSVPRVKRKK